MKTVIAASLGCVLTGMSACAWDSFGHMAVAYVAYQDLTPPMKLRASQLIQLNPQYTTWSGWVPASTPQTNRDVVIFMLAATWPDEIKGAPPSIPIPTNPVTHHVYVADGSSDGDQPAGSPNPGANEGYSDNSMHKYWHFVPTPFATDGTPLPPLPTPNAQDRIALFRSVLSSDQPDELKSYDLVWLMHLVGDVHQPLHCTTRVSQTLPKGDEGGNDVKLSGSGELHAFWDDVLGSGNQREVIAQVINTAQALPAADSTQAADANEGDWVQQSFEMAKTNVYVSPIGTGAGPFTLTPAYEASARKIAGERIALAGARLANLIQANLK